MQFSWVRSLRLYSQSSASYFPQMMHCFVSSTSVAGFLFKPNFFLHAFSLWLCVVCLTLLLFFLTGLTLFFSNLFFKKKIDVCISCVALHLVFEYSLCRLPSEIVDILFRAYTEWQPLISDFWWYILDVVNLVLIFESMFYFLQSPNSYTKWDGQCFNCCNFILGILIKFSISLNLLVYSFF